MPQIPRMMLAAIGSVAIMLVATLGFVGTYQENEEGLPTFASESELRTFLSHERPDGSMGMGYLAPGASGSDGIKQEMSESFSNTNVQVSGVDEADSVKTDGEYIYAASSTNVTIVRAYPPESLNKVAVVDIESLANKNNSLSINGIFIADDQLIVIVSTYSNFFWMGENFSYEPPRTIVACYDITDRANPSLEHNISISGSYSTSRMIGDYVYVLTQSAIWSYGNELVLPLFWHDGIRNEILATDIHYDADVRQADSFLTLVSVDIKDGAHELLTVVAGWASVVYMSNNAMYFTVQKYEGTIEASEEIEFPVQSWTATTSIYKITIDGLKATIGPSGDVRGWLLNQFSMDEQGEHLRIATTTGWSTPENAVYVLDKEMNIVGDLKGLAPDERIYSSRFIGDMLYLVTFRQMDPLFVISLTDPTNPVVLGELEMPGFSSYLHPVDQDHILGIGMESGRLKIALYDISDPAKPTEQSKYLATDIWYSDALYDHRAVLFDLEKELLAIPAHTYGYEYANSSGPSSGFLVLTVSIADGIELKGFVTHIRNESRYWGYGDSRVLYIGEFLYSIDSGSIQANRLSDLEFVNSLTYAASQEGYWYIL